MTSLLAAALVIGCYFVVGMVAWSLCRAARAGDAVEEWRSLALADQDWYWNGGSGVRIPAAGHVGRPPPA